MREVTKQKINEPILNVKKIVALQFVILWEVVSNIIPLLFGVQINPIWIVFNLIAGIITIVIIAIMRAAYPLEVPDATISQAFFLFFKRVVDTVIGYINKEDDTSRDDALSLLERNIVWSIHEWDILNKEKMQEFIDYYKTKNGNKEPTKEELEVKIAELESQL